MTFFPAFFFCPKILELRASWIIRSIKLPLLHELCMIFVTYINAVIIIVTYDSNKVIILEVIKSIRR